MIEARNISNSEVQAYLACKRMYNFAFIHNLAPKVTSTPLARGTTGHLAFQRYVEARLNGSNHQQSMTYALNAFQESMDNGVGVDIVLHAQFLWTRYMDHHKGWPSWELLGTEERKDLPITDEINFPIRYDLYARDVTTDHYFILDFKFNYDFWSPHDHKINAQMPKYITVMKANGYRVDGGYLEEIRTRQLGAEKSSDYNNLWKRTPYRPSKARTRAMMQQQIAGSMEVINHRGLQGAELEAASIPIYNKFGHCKVCSFKSLCDSMTEGATIADLAVSIREDYTENTYGYNQTIMEDLI